MSAVPQNSADATPPLPAAIEHPRREAPAGGRLLRLDGADDQIARRVHMSLRATGRQPLATVSVAVNAGRVTLQGTVPSYYLKQLAQHTALQVTGVTQLDSLLTVG